MSKLILPDLIRVQLVKPLGTFPLDKILLYIKTYASHKNDFHLGPFVSDKKGLITITKVDLDSAVAATYSSGLMDYSPIESSFSFVELRLYNQEEIDRLIQYWTNECASLFGGEEKRWSSVNHLVDTLNKSNNKLLLLDDAIRFVRAEFDGAQREYEFDLSLYKK